MSTVVTPTNSDHVNALYRRHQISVLFITFIAYVSFHASRKPPSIVKSVLAPDPNSHTVTSGWAPFDGPQGPHRLGELDLAFLSSYSLGMYLAGHFGDRIDLRRFLSFGMIGSGVTTLLFGLGFWFRIHSLAFYVMVQVLAGALQSIGWPCVVAVVGNWFGKERKGFIMGVWSSNASVGNIVGSVVAAGLLQYGWGWSFVAPAGGIVLVGMFVLWSLVARPQDVGLEMDQLVEIEMDDQGFDGEELGLLVETNGDLPETNEIVETGAIGFIDAWRLPGVASYACCLFFSKLVSYSFLYWLPFYIRHTAVAGQHLSHKTSGILSTVFDVGGVFGGVCAGYISDKLEAHAITSIIFLIISIPALIFYRILGGITMSLNIFLMFLSGFFVNGPYSLITTAVSADLSVQDTIKGNSRRCLATVSAIIDGTGSVGAALGPLLTGYISTSGWNNVFAMLILSISLACLFLIHLAKAEIFSKMNARK